MTYVGRFAPSPTGPLHAGSMAAALASWLDARAHQGRWLVRIEDVDRPRCLPGMGEFQLQQLAQCGLIPDEPVHWQSTRDAAYQSALDRLLQCGRAYPCACSRREIDLALSESGAPHERFGERIYPGTCRPDRGGLRGRSGRAVRFEVHGAVGWQDRRLGPQRQDVETEVGDFVIRRADSLWSYQLAVVVDDAAQGVSHVVRGEDLADNTARQILLQRALEVPTPAYLHAPLVRSADGHKLSKQNGAKAVDTSNPLLVLRQSAMALGLPAVQESGMTDWLGAATNAWAGMIAAFESSTRTLMITNPSGLQYQDTMVGDGATATAGQRVKVHYTGWLNDPAQPDGRGKKFDSSKDRNDPFVFPLGAGHVIGGWDEGVQGMKVGGTRVLLIPPELGYGARGAGGVIPPNATLVFEVELLGT